VYDPYACKRVNIYINPELRQKAELARLEMGVKSFSEFVAQAVDAHIKRHEHKMRMRNIRRGGGAKTCTWD